MKRLRGLIAAFRAALLGAWRWDGTWPRTLVFVAVVVIAGWNVVESHAQDHAEFVADKVLQRNHRLVEGDITEAGPGHRFLVPTMTTRDDFVGRYVATAVDIDGAIQYKKTVSGPNLETKDKNHVIVWISLIDLPPADIATLDVHRELDVCNIDGKEGCGKFPVEAIACDSKEMGGATCSAGVQITKEQRYRLFSALDKAAAAAKKSAAGEPETTPKPATPSTVAASKNGAAKKSGAGEGGRNAPMIHVTIHHAQATPAPSPSR